MSQLPREELAEIFFQEITDYLPEIGLKLPALQKKVADDETLHEIRRLFHTINDAASSTAFLQVNKGATHCKNIIETAIEKNKPLTSDEIRVLTSFYQNLNTLYTRSDRAQALDQCDFTMEFSPENHNETNATKSFDARSNKPVEIEKKEIIRSILPLLRELADCSSQMPLAELSHSVILPMRRAINTLADCTLTVNLSSQHDLLSNFYILLDHLALSPELLSPDIPTFLQECVTYLDLVFSLSSEESQRVIYRIQDRIHAINELILIGNTGSLQATPHQTSQKQHSREQYTDNTFEEKLQKPAALEEEKEQTEQDELLAIFKEECEEHLRTINTSLHDLEQNITAEVTDFSPELLSSVAEMRRAVHTLKGAAGMFGSLHVASSAHRFEDFLDWLHDEAEDITRKDLQIIGETLDCIGNLARKTTKKDEETVQTLVENIQSHLDSRTSEILREEALQPQAPSSTDKIPEEKLQKPAALEEEKEQTEQDELLAVFKEECEEHLRTINTSLHDLEQNITTEITNFSPELLSSVAEMRRAVHTLKGAAGMFGSLHVASSAHRFEDFLDWLHDEAEDITRKDLQLIGETLDCIGNLARKTTKKDEETVQALIENIQSHLDSRTSEILSEEEPLQPQMPSSSADKIPEEKLQKPADLEKEKKQTEQDELLAIFKEECEEHLRTINTSLHDLEQNITTEVTDFSPELLSSVAEMRRAVHTLKGAAGITGFLHVASSAHRFEDFLDWLHDEAEDITRKDLQIIGEALDCIENLAKKTTKKDEETAQTLIENIQSHLDSRTTEILREEALQPQAPSSAGKIPREKLQKPVALEKEKKQTEQNELLAIFKEECEEHLRTINTSLHDLEQNITAEVTNFSPELLSSVAEMRRAVHTLKGAAGMFGLLHVASSAHRFEDFLDWLHDEAEDITRKDLQIIGETLDCIENLARKTTKKDEETAQTLIENIQCHLDSRTAGILSAEEPLQPQTPSSADKLPEEKPEKPIALHEEKDLNSVFPEAAALSDTTHNVQVKLEDLAKLAGNEEELITTRVALEKLLVQVSNTVTELSATQTTLSQKTQELEVGFEVQSLYDFGPSPAPGKQQAIPVIKETAFSEFDPIELDQYSQLNLIIRSLNEISADINAIYNQFNGIMNEMHRHISKQQITMKMMQERLMRIQMAPLSSLSLIFYRTVRQTAKTLHKEVQLVFTGEDIYMDRHIWAKIVDPIMHILRNSIDHGIEPREQRKAKGKSEIGQIKVDTKQRNRYVIVRISDDGQGVNIKELFNKLAAEGFIDSTKKYTDEELLNFLFQPSFSTKKEISQVSGRGVGLDVVARNIQELRGKITIQNKEGKGLSFTLQIPITLAINKAVFITLSGETFAIPIQDIVAVSRFRDDELSNLHNNKVRYHDEDIEVIDLAHSLQLQREAEFYDRTTQLMLIIENNEAYQAFIVDDILEQHEIVIKPLGSHLRYVRGINGVTLTGEGVIIPILNLQELAITPQKVAHTKENEPISHPEKTTTPLQVLIVDDSVSIRHFTSLLIERQSWVANQAIDGIDALEKLAEYRPDIIILDVEMPRMNGYEFLAALKTKEEHAAIPVIMLTSRVSNKHRKKAEELGAAAYTTKPYQEEEFIALIQDVIQNK